MMPDRIIDPSTGLAVDFDMLLKPADIRGPATFTTVASAAASTALLPANPARKGLIIVNTDANALYVDLSGGAASITRYAKKIVTDEHWECRTAPTSAITGFWPVDGTGSALITEIS